MSPTPDHLARQGISPEDKEAFVFAAPDGGPLWARNFRIRFWDPAVKAAELDGLTFHELRLTAAAILVAEGFHPKVIQQRLGHASVRTTMDIYGHLLESVEAGVTARLEAIFGEREPNAEGRRRPGRDRQGTPMARRPARAIRTRIRGHRRDP